MAMEEDEGFTELVYYTIPGYLGGLGLGALLDALGFSESLLGEIVVRTLSGEGESIFEGVYAVRDRLAGGATSMAAAYGWGKLFGMSVPVAIHLASVALGRDLLGVETFYVPYFYGMSDQIGANVVGFHHLYRDEGGIRDAAARYLRHPVMVTSLAVILSLPFVLFLVRAAGYQPDTQVKAALETIVANLCWIPPVVGGLVERRHRA